MTDARVSPTAIVLALLLPLAPAVAAQEGGFEAGRLDDGETWTPVFDIVFRPHRGT